MSAVTWALVDPADVVVDVATHLVALTPRCPSWAVWRLYGDAPPPGARLRPGSGDVCWVENSFDIGRATAVEVVHG